MGPSQGSPDGVLDLLSAGSERLTFRLGVAFRDPLRPPPPPGSLLPARYVQVQVASPPPPRVDGTSWDDGLRLSDGRPFDPSRPPADGRVVPVTGIAPLGRPDPRTIVFDRWLVLPAVSPTRALTRTFAFDTADPTETPLSFLSVFYPGLAADTVAGVSYYTDGELVFDRPLDTAVDGMYFAVSLGCFFPPERPSADYIVRVTPSKNRPRRGVAVAPTFPITAAWSADPAPADVAAKDTA